MTRIILHSLETALLLCSTSAIVLVSIEDYGKTPRITQAITLLGYAMSALVPATMLAWIWS